MELVCGWCKLKYMVDGKHDESCIVARFRIISVLDKITSRTIFRKRIGRNTWFCWLSNPTMNSSALQSCFSVVLFSKLTRARKKSRISSQQLTRFGTANFGCVHDLHDASIFVVKSPTTIFLVHANIFCWLPVISQRTSWLPLKDKSTTVGVIDHRKSSSQKLKISGDWTFR